MAFSLSFLDPTSSRAPLGGFVRQGLSALPGGSTALGIVDATNARRVTDRSATTDRGAAPPPSGSAPWYARPFVIAAAAGAVLLLVGALVFLRRK